MILAECKGFLRTCATVTGCGALCSIALSVWLLFGRPLSPPIFLATMSLFFLAFLTWLPVMLLLSEYTRATRGPCSRETVKVLRRVSIRANVGFK